jgi:hypothetical protein
MHGTSAGVPVTLSGLGGLVTLAKPETVPEGASPRTYDTDYNVGSARSRAGLANVYTAATASVGPNLPTSANSPTWLNPANILLNDGSYTTQTPVNVSNALNCVTFAFNVPLTTSITGVEVAVNGFSDVPCDLTAQLLIANSPAGEIKTLPLPVTTAATLTFGALDDLWTLFPRPGDVNELTFGVQFSAASTGFDLATVSLDFCTITLGVNPGTSNFQFITTFTAQNGDVKNLSLDANGNFYVEDVTNAPGVQTLVLEGITPNSYAVGVNGPDVEYLAFSDGLKGSDMPLQYTADWIDRITQVGPGAAPTFTPISSSADVFTISTITQPAAEGGFGPRTSSYFLWSNGPGSTAAGNVITTYYNDLVAAPSGADTDLINAVNSGNPVYLYYHFTGTSSPYGPQVVLVTSVGTGQPPGQPRNFNYFTFTVPTVAAEFFPGSGHPGNTANYQRTLATMTTTTAVPGLTDGDDITITGASVSAWDSTWTISQTPNSGQYVITSSSVTSGVATFGYAETGGTTSPPAAGQLVTITGTTNDGGGLNLANVPIVSSSGGPTGTFTVNVSLPDATSAAESGLATTAGNIFDFDPGAQFVGTSTNPIFGNSTGGSFTFQANGSLIANGTRQGTVFFITRNGYFTYPAVPVTFTTPIGTTGISVTNIPIGPPNVVARGIAITEAGQNGVPGASFFYLPNQVQVIVNDVIQTSTSFKIPDNISTSATLAFSDDVLLNSIDIGTYGYNLFNQIEIGDPAWIVTYASRTAVGLCVNKVQNFNNLSFDGGYLPSSRLTPLGWTINDPTYGRLTVSPKFGNAWYIQNTSGGTLATAGSISQSAYLFQDTSPPGTTDGTPIIEPNTTYSVRVTARIPSGDGIGNLTITLSNLSVPVGTFTLPFSSMSSNYAIYEGTLLTTALPTVPSGLQLTVAATEIGATADVEIDRIDIIPTAIPVLTTTVYLSYAGLPEQFDAVTGQVIFASENQQPVNGAVVMYDTFYALKGWAGTAPGASLYSLQSTANLEPADWAEPEVAQKSGAIGVLAYDFGEQWIVMANRNGLYLFEGGQPGKINHEIIEVWNAINWTAAKSIWVRNLVSERKLLIGVPLPTPNFWLPNAPVNESPTTPNVMLMLNYQGLDSGELLKSEPQMHTTMFGTLTAIDMRRKWSIWQIPSPYAQICPGSADQQLYICNGRGNSKVYRLDPDAETDDGIFIDSLYTTAGLVPTAKRMETPGVGSFRLRWGYLVAALESAGNIEVRLLPNRLLFPEPLTGYNTWTVPGGFSPGSPALNDAECSLNFAATRTFFEFRENDGHSYTLSNVIAHAKKDVWNAVRGAK